MRIVDKPKQKTVKIAGIRFSYEFFENFKDIPLGTPFVVKERSDGIIVVEIYRIKKWLRFLIKLFG